MGVQQVLGATRSSRMGRAMAWNGAGGPPKVDQPCAGGEGEGEGVAELQGRRLGHRRRSRLDMGCGGGGGGGGMGEASGAAPAMEAWRQQERVKKTCDVVGEGVSTVAVFSVVTSVWMVTPCEMQRKMQGFSFSAYFATLFLSTEGLITFAAYRVMCQAQSF